MQTSILDRKDRVRDNTSVNVNFQIDKETFERIKQLRRQGPEAIRERLRQIEGEWDIERALELNFAALTITGVILGATVSRRWFALPGIAAVFLAQHSLQGWCPPLPLLRALGIRTQKEIEEERDLLLRLL